MEFHQALINKVLIQSSEEEQGWHSSNYSLLRISPELISFYDYEENPVQQFQYQIDPSLNIILLPDGTPFGQIKQQNDQRIDILKSDLSTLHFVRVPETTFDISQKEIDQLYAHSHWVTQQLGFQMRFRYVSNLHLEKYKQNTGVPTLEMNNQMVFNFTIVETFGKWFFILFADRILIDALPVHMITDDAIEVYASMLPPSIRVLNRTT